MLHLQHAEMTYPGRTSPRRVIDPFVFQEKKKKRNVISIIFLSVVVHSRFYKFNMTAYLCFAGASSCRS